MNILPKKRWHVRTKENIARVRRDEAEAAEKEKQERLRTENADREARLKILKEKSKKKLQDFGTIESAQEQAIPKHINLFADFDYTVQTTNKEHDKEVKEKKEEYEKKIGYLTYLGQDTNEILKKKNWYEVSPGSSRFSRSSEIKDTYDKLVLKDEDGRPKTKEIFIKDGEISWKAKQYLDPLNIFKKFNPEKNKSETKANKIIPYENDSNVVKSHKNISKMKKNKKDKDSKEEILQKLREARLKREEQERHKTQMFLTGLHEPNTKIELQNTPKVKAKYNSQFNPELARQNYN